MTSPKLLNPSPSIDEIERGYASSVDAVPSWWLIYDGKEFYASLACVCGRLRPINPDANGYIKYHHKGNCHFKGKFKLKGFDVENFIRNKKR
jgi:hypothetical protein